MVTPGEDVLAGQKLVAALVCVRERLLWPEGVPPAEGTEPPEQREVQLSELAPETPASVDEQNCAHVAWVKLVACQAAQKEEQTVEVDAPRSGASLLEQAVLQSARDTGWPPTPPLPFEGQVQTWLPGGPPIMPLPPDGGPPIMPLPPAGGPPIMFPEGGPPLPPEAGGPPVDMDGGPPEEEEGGPPLALEGGPPEDSSKVLCEVDGGPPEEEGGPLIALEGGPPEFMEGGPPD